MLIVCNPCEQSQAKDLHFYQTAACIDRNGGIARLCGCSTGFAFVEVHCFRSKSVQVIQKTHHLARLKRLHRSSSDQPLKDLEPCRGRECPFFEAYQ